MKDVIGGHDVAFDDFVQAGYHDGQVLDRTDQLMLRSTGGVGEFPLPIEHCLRRRRPMGQARSGCLHLRDSLIDGDYVLLV